MPQVPKTKLLLGRVDVVVDIVRGRGDGVGGDGADAMDDGRVSGGSQFF